MAKIEINLPSSQNKLDVIEQYMVYGEGYTDEIPNPDYDPVEFLDEGVTPNPNYDPAETIPNPESKLAFLNRISGRILLNYLKLKIRNEAFSNAEQLGNDTWQS